MLKRFYPVILVFTAFILGACADKFDINQFNDNTGNVNVGGDTVYVEKGQPWGGFNNPRAMIMGREPYLYVCDTDNNRIVMLNIAGQVMGTLSIKRPVAITQDYRLNLIVCAEFDTVNTTYSAVYKINLFDAGNHIENAAVTRLLPKGSDFNYPQRKYTAVTAFYDNSFFVARTGPANTSPFDPDNSILKFQPKKAFGHGEGDTLIGRVPFIDPLSQGLISANGINSMTAFNKKNFDFIATLSGQSSFKAQWFYFFVSSIDERYISQFNPTTDGVSFVKPNRFGSPTGSCIDEGGNIFVADPGKDSVFKFNSSGDEMESFGGASFFSRPQAVAFHDKTLYVLDSEKNAILRYQLSTDIQ